jgi:hypothetical protein
MADTKISALPASTTPLAGTEVLPIVQGGATKQVSVANLTAGRAISATSVTASTGNFVVGTSGQGIDFSATPGTGTSELFDDYEKGTWTPTLNATGFSGATYSTQAGHYTKVGNQITLYFDITLSALTSGGSNYLRIEGIPYVTASTNQCSASVFSENLTGGTSGRYIVLNNGGGQTSIVFWEMGPDGNATGTGMQGSRLTATTRFAGCITYQTA